MARIIITGTPATGKTTLAKMIMSKINVNFKYIDISKYVKENKLYDHYDNELETYIVDENILIQNLINELKNARNFILDGILSYYLPKDLVDLCIVTKCKIELLYKRLKIRGYKENKINENLQAEIFNVCYEEAISRHKNVFVIHTDDINTFNDEFNKLIKIINKLKL